MRAANRIHQEIVYLKSIDTKIDHEVKKKTWKDNSDHL